MPSPKIGMPSPNHDMKMAIKCVLMSGKGVSSCKVMPPSREAVQLLIEFEEGPTNKGGIALWHEGLLFGLILHVKL
jgi:hypothetical protein